MSCFRIIQELLNNSMRHSSADRIEISIMFYPLELEITVADNGIGIIIPDQRSGVGWWIIEHRAKQLNAEIQVERPPVINGTKVTLKIPR
jgi:signal transduction histidine kinase